MFMIPRDSISNRVLVMPLPDVLIFHSFAESVCHGPRIDPIHLERDDAALHARPGHAP